MATRYLTRFMVHPAPGKVRNTTTVMALDITAFLGYCSDIHSRGRNEDRNIYTFTPSSSKEKELSGGFGVWVFREEASRIRLPPNLQLWLENKVQA